jgi:hypothetical protein
LLEAETGQQKQYNLAEAMTGRLNSRNFEQNIALLEARLNETEPKF